MGGDGHLSKIKSKIRVYKQTFLCSLTSHFAERWARAMQFSMNEAKKLYFKIGYRMRNIFHRTYGKKWEICEKMRIFGRHASHNRCIFFIFHWKYPELMQQLTFSFQILNALLLLSTSNLVLKNKVCSKVFIYAYFAYEKMCHTWLWI